MKQWKTLNKNKPIVIYWASSGSFERNDWMLYRDPENLQDELIKMKEPRSERESFFNCPAVVSRIKNIFVFKNATEIEFLYDFTDSNNEKIITTKGIQAQYLKPSSIKGGSYAGLPLQWVFFAEEEVEILINSPSHHPISELQEKAILPFGKIDPSKYFRPFSYEIQIRDLAGKITIKENEPLFYLEILTDRPVILKRFVYTEKIRSYANHAGSIRHVFGKMMPLIEKYKAFKESRMTEIVLKEIKENLI